MISDPLDIPFTDKPLSGKIKVPGSKSITNRALVLSALAKGTSTIKGYLDSEDTNIMMNALRSLGVQIQKQDDCLLVEGISGNFASFEGSIFVGNAGTAARFLCPLLSLGKGSYQIDGSPRMRQRPIAELLRAMESIGGKSKPLHQMTQNQQSFPLVVEATELVGGEIELLGNISSQFISGLMMVAPFAKKDTLIKITTEIISLPYIEMTRKMMEIFGVSCEWVGASQLLIASNQQYQARDYQVEGDASASSYFFAAAAITGSKVCVYPATPNSLQGDIGFLQILKNMGCKLEWGLGEVCVLGADLNAVEVDMSQQNDVALTLAVVALFAKGTTKIKNIYNLRLKECDRINALATELSKLGAKVKEGKDSLTIIGGGVQHGAQIDTYQDHRIAMAFSLCGLKISGIQIKDPLCVQKTYPNYWQDFFSLLS